MLKKILIIVLFAVFAICIPASYAQNNEDEYFYLPQERNLMDTAQYEQARKTFEEKFAGAQKAQNNRDMAKYKKNIADTYLRSGDLIKSVELYKEALKLVENVDDQKLKRSILHNIGVSFANQGFYDDAQNYYQQALDISESLDYTYGIISGYNNIGNLFFNQADYEKAEEYLLKALEAAKNSEIKEYELSVSQNLANIYNFTGKLDRAKEMYLNIINGSKNYADKTLYADAKHNLGILNQELGNYSDAIKDYLEALKIYEDYGDKKKISQTYQSLGRVYFEESFVTQDIQKKMYAYHSSFVYFNKAFDLAKEINAQDTALTALRQIFGMRNALITSCADINASEEQFKKNLDTMKKLYGEETVKVLSSFSQKSDICSQINVDEELNQSVKEQEKFIEYYKEFKYNRLLPDAYWSLANDYFWLGNFDKSIENFNKSIDLRKKYFEPNLWRSYFELGQTYSLMSKALLQKSNAAEITEAEANKIDEYQKLESQAYDNAIAEVKKISNNITAEKDKEAYIDLKQKLFEKAALMKILQGKPFEARDLLEYAKISEQNDYFTDLLLKHPEDKLSEPMKLAKEATQTRAKAAGIASQISKEAEKPEDKQNPEKIENLQAQLHKARQDFQKTALKIQQEYPEVLKYVAIKPTNLRTLQRMLPEDTVIIEPVIIENKVVIFVGPPGNKLPVYKETSYDDLNVLGSLIAFRKAIYARDDEKILEKSKELYDILIKPVEKEIEPYKVLVISPYENLRYIPFQALYDGKKFLIEKFDVVNATSSSGLKIANQQPVKEFSLLAFGNATEDLPEAEKEVESISSVFDNFKVFLRKDASRDTFDNEIYNDYKIVHLATHGVLNNDNPEQSKLLFSGDTDSYLTVDDILGYDFSGKNLIVLSACDSAIGKAKGAEVSALGTAFELAAAPTVIASLWKVNDKSTAIMMDEFYKHLLQGDSKVEALRKSQLSLLKDPRFSNPYFWSPFIILGEWQ